MYLYFVSFVILLYIWFDINYFVRAFFIVLSGRLFQKVQSLNKVSTIYGICTTQDCDVWFRNARVSRLIRDIDFARYHFYMCSGIYQRSQSFKIRSLQGCTFTVYEESVPLWAIYKINTKLVYWDACSLFFEHEIITLHDGRLRYFIISRQHAIGANGDSTDVLLEGLPDAEKIRNCPEQIVKWLKSMQLISKRIRIPVE